MNYALAREVYGNSIWMVDRLSFSTLSNMLKDFRSGVQFAGTEAEKLNCVGYISISSATRTVSYSNQIPDDAADDYISVININGPITKNGGMSSYGMKDVAKQANKLDANSKVIGHIFLADSGGGSSAGMEVMNYAIDNLTKPTATVIERGGVAASAMYGIAAHTGRIFAESEKVQVGSIGSMISFAAQPNKAVNSQGEKQVTIYATPSTKKNLWFEEALNNDNYALAISEILDPHVEDFRQDMRDKRPGIKETQLDGSDYLAGDVIGSLVDEIGGIPEAVKYIIAKSKGVSNSNILQINSKTAMTASEVLAQHPTVHAEIFGAGAAAERDRVESWMTYNHLDPEAVQKGIESGGQISAKAREAFNLKATTAALLGKVKDDSAKDIVPEEAQQDASKDLSPKQKSDKADFDAAFSSYGVKFENFKNN